MDVNFEILVVFSMAVIFSILYLNTKEHGVKLVLGLMSAIVWLSLGVSFIATTPTFPAYSLLFFGVGMVFVILTMYDVWYAKKEKIWSFREE